MTRYLVARATLPTDVVLPGKVRRRELAERVGKVPAEVKVLFMSG